MTLKSWKTSTKDFTLSILKSVITKWILSLISAYFPAKRFINDFEHLSWAMTTCLILLPILVFICFSLVSKCIKQEELLQEQKEKLNKKEKLIKFLLSRKRENGFLFIGGNDDPYCSNCEKPYRREGGRITCVGCKDTVSFIYATNMCPRIKNSSLILGNNEPFPELKIRHENPLSEI